MMPGNAKGRHLHVEQRLKDMAADACNMPINKMEINDTKIGFITSGIAYQYVKEACPDASVLKLGLVHPLPRKLIEEFASKVETLYIFEELEPVIEEQVRAWGFDVKGKELFTKQGEYSSNMLRRVLYGKDEASYKGQGKLRVTDGTNTKELILKPDGTFTWGGNNVITTKYSGAISITNTNTAESGQFQICGGTNWQAGSMITVYGKSNANRPGWLYLSAHDGTNTNVLIGKPDGALTWGNVNIVRSVNGTVADASGNVTVPASFGLPNIGGSPNTVYTASNKNVTIPANGYLILTYYQDDTGDAGNASFTLYLNGNNITAGAAGYEIDFVPVKAGDIIKLSQNQCTVKYTLYHNV